MKVGLNANATDLDTNEIGWKLRPIFKDLSERLEGDYGGVIEHLWIDLELVESWSKKDGTARHRFRFQKRVSGSPPSTCKGMRSLPDWHNVGHFSVRPDFSFLLSLPLENVDSYVLQILYTATEVLLSKKSRLGGFNAEQFRKRFITECQALGYQIDT
ncbi:hypothetical protein [Herbaspirillum chlorophenolicum]|uniref:hypothetical protein n=2 Tax=Herbaspirillum chlorophenolicum TaxID=211589 RepID=UPI0012E70709|nr:hypothetical protein [Herbaspirillum chlorophenolicum]